MRGKDTALKRLSSRRRIGNVSLRIRKMKIGKEYKSSETKG